MTVCVFISSTSEDLKQDCRQTVICAVQEANCVAVTMELWNTEYQPPVEVCHDKLKKDSTHYLGIFAYRRGWVPPTLKKSITEAEFDWALAYQKPMAIFIPRAGTDFGAELLRRAASQAPEDTAAQKAFLERVKSNGTVVMFEDVLALSRSATRQVMLWAHGGLRAIAAQAPSTSLPQPSNLYRIPSDSEILKLGRLEQRRRFRTSLEQITALALPEIACFVLHGASGYGHSECQIALRQEFESLCADPPRQLRLAIKPGWGQNSTARLLENLGSQIEPGWQPTTPQELAARLATISTIGDILIEISNVQRFDNSLRGFVTSFWQPLARALNDGYRRRLVVVLTLEQSDVTPWQDLLQPPLDEEATTHDPQRPIQLPQLEAFTQKELFAWLKSRMPTLDAAKELATTLFEETAGQPQVLYAKLSAKDTWPEE
jgi:hypothetical protein